MADDSAGRRTEMSASENEAEFYIVDLRPEWRRQRYVTLWRADDRGYCWSLPWAGLYSQSRVDSAPGYYASRGSNGRFDRFPVPRSAVERLAIHKPAQSASIDTDAGPVMLNDESTRRALRAKRYLPACPAAPNPEEPNR